MDLPEVERLQAVTVQSDDVIVVTVPADTTAEEAARVQAVVATKFPGHKVIVVTAGIEVLTMRPDGAP